MAQHAPLSYLPHRAYFCVLCQHKYTGPKTCPQCQQLLYTTESSLSDDHQAALSVKPDVKVAAQPQFDAPNAGGVQYQLLQQIPTSSFGIPKSLK